MIGKLSRKENPWDILGEALIDYILPQLDRLDIETLSQARLSAYSTFKEGNLKPVKQIDDFILKLDDKINELNKLNELFKR